MITRLGKIFNSSTINEAGMFTRSGKKKFDSLYGETARKTQEQRRMVPKSLQKLKYMINVNQPKFHDWVSPSLMKNYFNSDPFMSIFYNTSRSLSVEGKSNLTERNNQTTHCISSSSVGEKTNEENRNNQTKSKEELNFQNKLAEEGLEFEKKVYEYYRNFFTPEEMIIFESEDHGKMVVNEEKRNATIHNMLKGTPIICQAVLWNESLKLYGIADMIVRSDYIKKLVNEFKMSENDEGLDVRAPKLNGQYHYRVIDIKSKTIDILKDGFSLSNNEAHRYYKAQLWSYNSEISRIQGYDSHMAYILGKRSECLKQRTNIFNETFGVVDFHKDTYVKDEVIKCLEWIREARKYNMKQLLKLRTPLPRYELYPNMRKIFDENKNKFAQHIREISSIYFCGKTQRDKAIAQNVFSYDDTRISAEMLGFKDGHRQKCVDVDIILSRTKQPIYPTKECGLKTPFFREPRNEFTVVDFEFLSEPNFNHLPEIKQLEMVFMIGYYSKNLTLGVVEEKTFVVDSLDLNSECAMATSFVDFLIDSCDSHSQSVQNNTERKDEGKRIELHHWGAADVNQWEKLLYKYPFLNERLAAKNIEVHFIDMSEICKQEPIMVCDAHGFGLKSYVKNMVEKKIFNSEAWQGMDCVHGNDAVCYIKKASLSLGVGEKKLGDHPLTKEVIKYNQADCKVVYEIYQGLRNYYELF